MDESCHIWMNHIQYERVMSHSYNAVTHTHPTSSLPRKNTSTQDGNQVVRHVTCECITHTNQRHIRMNHTYGWVTHMNESCHIWARHVNYEANMSHLNISKTAMQDGDQVVSHVTCECITHTNESHIYEWITHMNEYCHIWARHVNYAGVVSRMNMSKTAMQDGDRVASHVTYECITHMNQSYIWMSTATYERVMWIMKQTCLIWIF